MRAYDFCTAESWERRAAKSSVDDSTLAAGCELDVGWVLAEGVASEDVAVDVVVVVVGAANARSRPALASALCFSLSSSSLLLPSNTMPANTHEWERAHQNKT